MSDSLPKMADLLGKPIGIRTVRGGRRLMQPKYTDRYQVRYDQGVINAAKGPTGRRRGRGARERILGAARELFRGQGIARTGMDQLCTIAQVSKRTAYQHFPSKDVLVAEYLRGLDPEVLPGIFGRTDLSPRERLLAAFDFSASTPMCPYISAAVELHDPAHPASAYAREYKSAVTRRLAATARDAGANHPEQLGEQLALLIDGAAARTHVLDSDAWPAAAAVARVLIEEAIP